MFDIHTTRDETEPRAQLNFCMHPKFLKAAQRIFMYLLFINSDLYAPLVSLKTLYNQETLEL